MIRRIGRPFRRLHQHEDRIIPRFRLSRLMRSVYTSTNIKRTNDTNADLCDQEATLAQAQKRSLAGDRIRHQAGCMLFYLFKSKPEMRCPMATCADCDFPGDTNGDVNLPGNKAITLVATCDATWVQKVHFQFEFIDPKTGEAPPDPCWCSTEMKQEFGRMSFHTPNHPENAVMGWYWTEEGGPAQVTRHSMSNGIKFTTEDGGGGKKDTTVTFTWD